MLQKDSSAHRCKKKKKKKNCYSLHPDILAFGVQNFAQNTSI
jgi:hypothetical protein